VRSPISKVVLRNERILGERTAARFIAPAEQHQVHAWWGYEGDFKRRIALETVMRQMFARESRD
jgi:hypothetical protein